MRIPINRDSDTPLYKQVEQFLRDEILSASLPADTRLPSSRELASGLGVNRITIANAYADLEAEGLVYSKPGSGTYVAPLEEQETGGAGENRSEQWPLWQQLLSQRAAPRLRNHSPGYANGFARSTRDSIDLSMGSGAGDFFPVDEFRKSLDTVLRRDRNDAIGYGERAGHYPLRRTIAHILANQGVPCQPENVLITTGSQQALMLVAHLLLRPGDTVLVESPSYSAALDLFASLDVVLIGVPVDEDGMRTDLLEDLLRTAHPRLIYTIPTFQNPTGTCMSGARRRQLIGLAARFNVPILEDEFVGDLRYDGRSQPALKSFDTGNNVIYTGTFSKMLMPGLRIGYIVAHGPVYENLLELKRINDLATSDLIQRALDTYISVGRYQSYLRRACREYRARRDAMASAIERRLPKEAQFGLPLGGLFIWLQLPPGVNDERVVRAAAEEKLALAPGCEHFPGQDVHGFLRLNFAMQNVEAIEEGIKRLGAAIAHVRPG